MAAEWFDRQHGKWPGSYSLSVAGRQQGLEQEPRVTHRSSLRISAISYAWPSHWQSSQAWPEATFDWFSHQVYYGVFYCIWRAASPKDMVLAMFSSILTGSYWNVLRHCLRCKWYNGSEVLSSAFQYLCVLCIGACLPVSLANPSPVKGTRPSPKPQDFHILWVCHHINNLFLAQSQLRAHSQHDQPVFPCLPHWQTVLSSAHMYGAQLGTILLSLSHSAAIHGPAWIKGIRQPYPLKPQKVSLTKPGTSC